MEELRESEGKQVIVPQSDIDNLEKARLALHKECDGCDTDVLIKLTKITEAMWQITHRKYPVVLLPDSNKERKKYIRKQALNAEALMNGHLPEQREKYSNALKTLEEFAGYILELT